LGKIKNWHGGGKRGVQIKKTGITADGKLTRLGDAAHFHCPELPECWLFSGPTPAPPTGTRKDYGYLF